MFYQEIPWTAYGVPLLALLQSLPLVAAGGIAAIKKPSVVFPLAMIAAAAEILLAVLLYLGFDQGSTAFQFAENYPVLGLFQYHAAVDGTAVLFTLLSTFLTFIVVLYGRARELKPAWRFLALVFAVEAAIVSQFVAINLLWFALASGIQLVLVGYLWQWTTSPERGTAFLRYLQFMGIASLLLLAGVIMMGWNYSEIAHGRWTFDLYELAKVPIQEKYRSIIFFLVFLGLAIRIPLFPLHGWLPLTAEHGTVAVMLVFLLGLKTGIYGLLRFVFPLMSEAVIYWHQAVVAVSVVGVFYAAVLALMQVNMRRLLAFAVVSHSGIMVIGLFSLGLTAFEGGVLLSVNFGLATAVLLFMTGFIFNRTGTTVLSRMGGLFGHLPLIGIAFLIGGLSIIGMPGTPGFDAVHLVLEASLMEFGAVLTISTAIGNVAAAGFLLWAFQRAFLAPCPETAMPLKIAPPQILDRTIAATLIVVLLAAGFHSSPWLELIDKSLEGLSTLYGHGT